MVYYYIHPFKPQYFFPEDFQDDPVFRSFFQAYSLKGKISWALLCKSEIYRRLFKKEDIKAFIPEKEIRSILKTDSSMAFNRGTPGPEQKITALGKENGEYFFVKYAFSPLARNNVINEYEVLKQLELSTEFAPNPQYFYRDKHQVLLKTEVLKGTRVKNTKLDESILHILLQLPDLDIRTQKDFDSELKKAFAHGDFCPWNLMDENDNKVLFDWEMGGTYPLGYDLFTFIFQTNFLLSPNMTVVKIVELNAGFIEKYFHHFGIQNWSPYLLEFANIKSTLEEKKGGEGLYSQFEMLKKYG